ncbi:class I adenylate-forming enzyme family protein [Paenisporosarcina sp. TG20]|uniref:class I adenylate-forming enzyme family protein n=1 Tax=Paenisporosarcina sp. TG20 TaxID=1211706 RepID=UPI0002DF1ED2|nr:AMP-binding protein [Paenisporosarcina sp. TG20]
MYNDQTWFLKRAKMAPSNLACIDIDSGQQWTYAQFVKLIQEWVHRLSLEKLKPGDRVAILAANHPELLAILFACGLKGYIYVPLNFRLSPIELIEIITNCEPAILITDHSYEVLSSSLSIKRIINREVHISLTVEAIEVTSVSADEPWMIIYTGGTTGKPKGVQLSYNNVNWNALNTIVSWGLSDTDCTVTYMPLFHTGGLNALSIPILMAGGTVVIGDRFDGDQALEEILTRKATISLFVPTMYQVMTQTEKFKNSDFPDVRFFLSGGAPCPITIYEQFEKKGLPFKEGYGLSEAGPNNFVIDANVAKIKRGSVGKNMQLVDTEIVSEMNQPVAINEVGELWIRGKHVFTGYWQNEKETEDVMHDEWLKTGDLAKMDADGDYYIVGRKKDMILTGGENVYPQEIEHCLIQHRMIKEAAVIGIPDVKWGEAVTAFVSLTDPDCFSEKQLIEHCRNFLAGFKVPKTFVILEELPKTHVGKINKKQLIYLKP